MKYFIIKYLVQGSATDNHREEWGQVQSLMADIYDASRRRAVIFEFIYVVGFHTVRYVQGRQTYKRGREEGKRRKTGRRENLL